MSDFCLDCFNKYISDEQKTEDDVIMQWDICEGCGKNKPCVIFVKSGDRIERELDD
jgi:hypothetical protein